MIKSKTLFCAGLVIAVFQTCVLADYANDVNTAVTNWNSIYGTNVIITGWTEIGIIANQTERDATVAEMTDPNQVYVVAGDPNDPNSITAVLMAGAPQEILDQWNATVDDIVAIGQHKIEISWKFVATQETFTTITVADDELRFDSMLFTILVPERFANVVKSATTGGSCAIYWLWPFHNSKRGEATWEVTCHSCPPAVCTIACNAWMNIGTAKIECMEEAGENYCKLYYGYSFETPTAKVTIFWNALKGKFDFVIGGIGSTVVGSGSITDPCPTECFHPCLPGYQQWVAVNKPLCWCVERQCHGDTDDTSECVKGKGCYYVHYKDLGQLLSAWNVREPPQGPGMAWPDHNICADFDHGPPECVKGKGCYRVHFKDMGILLANYNVREPPQGPGVNPNCLDCP